MQLFGHHFGQPFFMMTKKPPAIVPAIFQPFYETSFQPVCSRPTKSQTKNLNDISVQHLHFLGEISRKCRFLRESRIDRVPNPSRIVKDDSQRGMFVAILCQRVELIAIRNSHDIVVLQKSLQLLQWGSVRASTQRGVGDI